MLLGPDRSGTTAVGITNLLWICLTCPRRGCGVGSVGYIHRRLVSSRGSESDIWRVAASEQLTILSPNTPLLWAGILYEALFGSIVGGQTAPSSWRGVGCAWPGSRLPAKHGAADHAFLRPPPVPARGRRPRRPAVLQLPAEPAHGRGAAGRPRRHREPRDRAAVGAEGRPGFANESRRRLPRSGDRWHLDEVEIKIAGTKHRPWRAVDQDGTVLDVLVPSRRDRRRPSACSASC